MTYHQGTKRVINEGPVKGLDDDGEVVDVGLSGVDQNALSVLTEHGHLLREILVELKKNNKYLSILMEHEWETYEIEE